MIALIAYLGLIVQQLNIVEASSNDLLFKKETIYMIMPKRLHIREKLKKFCNFFRLFTGLSSHGEYRIKDLSDT